LRHGILFPWAAILIFSEKETGFILVLRRTSTNKPACRNTFLTVKATKLPVNFCHRLHGFSNLSYLTFKCSGLRHYLILSLEVAPNDAVSYPRRHESSTKLFVQ